MNNETKVEKKKKPKLKRLIKFCNRQVPCGICPKLISWSNRSKHRKRCLLLHQDSESNCAKVLRIRVTNLEKKMEKLENLLNDKKLLFKALMEGFEKNSKKSS